MKSLVERGLTRERIVRLFRLIDWMMTLPPVSQRVFHREVEEFEREKQMPVMTPSEKMWQEDGRIIGQASNYEKDAGMLCAVGC